MALRISELQAKLEAQAAEWGAQERSLAEDHEPPLIFPWRNVGNRIGRRWQQGKARVSAVIKQRSQRNRRRDRWDGTQETINSMLRAQETYLRAEPEPEEPSRSVRTVSGGLPGLGRRR